jgi:hypothetical protein
VKLKMAERLASGLAQTLKSEISDRERKMREEYENKMERLVKNSVLFPGYRGRHFWALFFPGWTIQFGLFGGASL